MCLADLRNKLGENPLFVIPCCAGNVAGGTRGAASPALTPQSDRARQEIAALHPDAFQGTEVKEARARYRGQLYIQPGVEQVLQDRQDDVLILSSAYGLLHPYDLIRQYDLPIATAGVYATWRDIVPGELATLSAQRSAIVGLFGHETRYAEIFRHPAQYACPRYLVSLAPAPGAQANVPVGSGLALAYLAGFGDLPRDRQYQIEVL